MGFNLRLEVCSVLNLSTERMLESILRHEALHASLGRKNNPDMTRELC